MLVNRVLAANGMSSATSPGPRSSAETKARIILVAQEVFSSKGYSHAGLREIAALAQVAPSLVIKYFGTKAQLFEKALAAAILPIRNFQRDRARIGEAIAASILTPQTKVMAPAMMALALGDAESRQIVERVVKDEIIDPMADWLDAPHSQARAMNLLAMTTGFAIFHGNMSGLLGPEDLEQSARLFAQSLQDLVDRD